MNITAPDFEWPAFTIPKGLSVFKFYCIQINIICIISIYIAAAQSTKKKEIEKRIINIPNWCNVTSKKCKAAPIYDNPPKRIEQRPIINKAQTPKHKFHDYPITDSVEYSDKIKSYRGIAIIIALLLSIISALFIWSNNIVWCTTITTSSKWIPQLYQSNIIFGDCSFIQTGWPLVIARSYVIDHWAWFIDIMNSFPFFFSLFFSLGFQKNSFLILLLFFFPICVFFFSYTHNKHTSFFIWTLIIFFLSFQFFDYNDQTYSHAIPISYRCCQSNNYHLTSNEYPLNLLLTCYCVNIKTKKHKE
ncbi:hypothetical protein RFI_26613 [Reticulomyxa filosa]|uniref:Uncharacterized protein n=1 Tax=Reticulomyxa filosa TaxID=46433 RepID=X6MCJ7_RETFI|nr:hypothetical protein RFI_26613 [Reticulomyxa filosa]|eukprot:ETO10765.1 hypothetical protein RFI_26613 [Reticulomyxa filosa]